MTRSWPGIAVCLVFAFVGYYGASLCFKAFGKLGDCNADQSAINALSTLLAASVIAAAVGTYWIMEEIPVAYITKKHNNLAEVFNPGDGSIFLGMAIVIAVGILYTTNGTLITNIDDDDDDCEEVKNAGKKIQTPGIIIISVAGVGAILMGIKKYMDMNKGK